MLVHSFSIKNPKKPVTVILSYACRSPPTPEMANRNYIIMTCIKIKLEKFLAEKSMHIVLLYFVKCTDVTEPDVRTYLGCGAGFTSLPILSFLNRKVWCLKLYWNK